MAENEAAGQRAAAAGLRSCLKLWLNKLLRIPLVERNERVIRFQDFQQPAASFQLWGKSMSKPPNAQKLINTSVTGGTLRLREVTRMHKKYSELSVQRRGWFVPGASRLTLHVWSE